MTVWYNEFDPYAADWLENLIAFDMIPAGVVDRRSIVDVRPEDLKGFTHCHFFAGIGGWAHALNLARWPLDRPVWTGSCPCQPFSAAGKRKGVADERHLWPEFRRLIAECAPATVFGEQVASTDGRTWLAGVSSDLEALGYAVGAADLCAAGVGAPHIRQRLWWLADAERIRREVAVQQCGGGRASVVVGKTNEPRGGGTTGRLGDTHDTRSQGRFDGPGESWRTDQRPVGPTGQPGFWSGYGIVQCTDGKARRFEPGSFPLAYGVPNRVGRLRGYGNAIVPQVAAEFVSAYLDI